MALIALDGFDMYPNLSVLQQVYSVEGSAISLSSTGGRFGGKAIEITSSNSSSFAYILPSLNTGVVWVAVAVFFTSAATSGSGSNVVEIKDDLGTPAAALGMVGDGTTTFKVTDEGGDIVGSSFNISANAWHWIEMSVEYGSASGAIKVSVDGVLELDATGDTDNFASSGITSIELSGVLGGDFFFDDLLVGDDSGTDNTTFPGDTKIVALSPDGAGSSANFTPTGAANNHEAVDELPSDEDTTYNISGTPGDRDTFSFENMPETPESIVGIGVRNVGRKEGTGAFAFSAVTISGTTTVVGDPAGLSNFYAADASDVFGTDPDTGSPWTESGVNAIEAGYEIP